MAKSDRPRKMPRTARIKEDPNAREHLNPVFLTTSQIYPEGSTSPLTEVQDDDPRLVTPIPGDNEVEDLDSASSRTLVDVNAVNKTLSTGKALMGGARRPPSLAPMAPGPPREEAGAMDAAETVKKTSSTGYDILGEDMRDMVNTINQLRMKGVEDLGLPLPRIAVIGNQSAGKSSLIEAISGIRVPRYAGTCTRCPLEITLTEDPSPTAQWHCKVSLRFHKQFKPKKKTGGDPWVEQQHEQYPFMNIDNPEMVEAAIVRAQLAILNPSQPWGQFVNMPVNGGNPVNTEVPFSPNVICMEITGNNVPNLSFIDLPGIIHVTERKEEEYLINLVRNLVEGYIRQEDCLILLAMTMKDDAVNQSAAQMARKLGPNRTIGALTKPDTVLAGEHEQWIKILRGQEHRLPHGYFVTRQPSQQQLLNRMTHEDARRYEDKFFSSMEPWNSEVADLSDRFGTVNLQKYLSRQLANLIRQRLPAIIRSVQDRSSQVQKQLDELPAPPVNSLRETLRKHLEAYLSVINDTVDARSDDNSFTSDWRKIAAKLKKDLIALRPRVNPDETSPQNPNSPFTSSAARNHLAIFSNSFSSTMSTPSKGRKRPSSHDDPPDEVSDPFNSGSGSGPPPRKKLAIEPRTPVKKAVISVEDEDIMETESLADVNFASDTVQPKVMHLKEIRNTLRDNSNTGIPGIVDPKAVDILVKMHIRLWDPSIQNFIQQFDALLYSHAYSHLKEIFRGYELSPLFQRLTEIIDEFHELIMSKIRRSVNKSFRIEADCVYTMQDQDWSREHVSWKQDNENRRKRAREEQLIIKQQRAQERQAQAGRKGKAEIPQPEATDPYQREIDTFTHTQAYVALARRRFGDVVMMRMLRGVFTKYTSTGTFREFMEQSLGLRDLGEEEQERKCRELMVEDPEKERLRNVLIGRRELLDKAWMDLEPFQRLGSGA